MICHPGRAASRPVGVAHSPESAGIERKALKCLLDKIGMSKIESNYGCIDQRFSGCFGQVRAGHRARGPRTAADQYQGLLRLRQSFWRAAEHPRLPGMSGLPGSLPVLNRQAVEFATLAAMALHSEVRPRSIFARKNYFYPDLPKGYQISQFDKPLAEHGWIEVPRERWQRTKRIGITRLHMEEDAGKSIHDGFAESATRPIVDLNRCGTPLIEIVSEPDIRTPDEAFEYLTRLKEILLYTGVSDCNMEEGSLRCDANVSVRPRGAEKFGTKAEVKNVNSFRFIRSALEYEIERQIEVIESGGRVAQETRLWNADEGRDLFHALERAGARLSLFSRARSAAAHLVAANVWIARHRGSMPEMPEARRARMIAEYEMTRAGCADTDRTRANLPTGLKPPPIRAKSPKPRGQLCCWAKWAAGSRPSAWSSNNRRSP